MLRTGVVKSEFRQDLPIGSSACKQGVVVCSTVIACVYLIPPVNI